MLVHPVLQEDTPLTRWIHRGCHPCGDRGSGGRAIGAQVGAVVRSYDGAVGELRRDARRNRERILAAARKLFAEQDLDVVTSDIARRAGIGAATVYRRFPTRDSLVAAVFTERVDECVSSILEASRDPDPWRGFSAAITALCTVDADGRGLTRAFLAAVPGGAAEFDGQRRVAEEAFADMVRRAKNAGTLRADFGRDDLSLVLAANAGLVHGGVAARRAASEKLAGYLLAGFRTSAVPASPAIGH